MLAKAEEVCFSGKVLSIEAAYDEAMNIANREGFTNYEAIPAERAGLAFKMLGEKEKATQYLKQSISLFNDCGATAKVEDMLKVHRGIGSHLW
jgi:predicted negative regulator of RcsB-dependent stress response